VKRCDEPANSTDVGLARRAQRGDSAALSELVTKYQDRIYNTCYRMCRNDADALDLTQTTFMKAIEALPRFEARATFFTWLYRIAVNLTLTHARDRRRRPVLTLHQSRADGEPSTDPPARENDGDPARRAEQRELRVLLEEALAGLDHEFRAAVILRDVEGLDYAAVAEILEIPIGTVKSRIFRGRTMLREYLENEAPKRGVG